MYQLPEFHTRFPWKTEKATCFGRNNKDGVALSGSAWSEFALLFTHSKNFSERTRLEAQGNVAIILAIPKIIEERDECAQQVTVLSDLNKINQKSITELSNQIIELKKQQDADAAEIKRLRAKALVGKSDCSYMTELLNKANDCIPETPMTSQIKATITNVVQNHLK